MRELEFQGGTVISAACIDLVKHAKRWNKHVFGVFNGVEIIASPISNPEELIQHFYDAQATRRDLYLRSPEYRESEIRRTQEVKASQALLDELVDDCLLNSFKSYEIIMCLVKMQPHTDLVGVNVPVGKIIKHLESLGYVRDANTGDDFNEGDIENFASYLIGQAMDMLLRMNAIHHGLLSLIYRWVNKFKDALNAI